MEIDPSMVFAIVAIFVGAAAVIAAMVFLSKRYIKVPPNKAMVISGRRYKGQRRNRQGEIEDVELGFRIVQGGAAFVIPVLERHDFLDLNTMQIKVMVRKVVTKEGVPLSVESTAQVKISSDFASLGTAAEQLLDMSENGIAAMADKLLVGYIRGSCTQLTIEDINADRAALAEMIQKQAVPDLLSLGLELTVFNIEDISDEVGYLEALGQRRTAEVKRDAEIGRANAERDQKIKVAEAKREAEIAEANALERDLKIQRTQAERDGSVQEATRQAEIAEAERDRDVRKEQYRAATAAEKARADASGKIEDQKQLQAVKDEEAKVREREEKIKQVIPAAKQADAVAITAEGQKKKTVIEAQAEAERIREIAKAEAEKTKITAAAEAERIKVTGDAPSRRRARKLSGGDREGLHPRRRQRQGRPRRARARARHGL